MTIGGAMSLPYRGSTPEEEERPGSSLSTASRSSRIPVLTRSHSLRVKSSGSCHEYTCGKGSKGAGRVHSDGRTSSKVATPAVGRGIVRSASFVSSRGMKGLPSTLSPYPSPYPHPTLRPALTPDTPRRATHAHAKRAPNSAPDRKTQASQPDTPSTRSPDTNDLEDDDSVKSFGSVSSAVSCDAALTHSRQSACGGSHGSAKGTRSFKYVLHCRHNHDNDVEQYLTPTQRAARKIRELKAQLSEARREVHTRDTEIARLTRELVELRLLKARQPHWQDHDDQEEAGGGGGGGGVDKATNKGGRGAPPPAVHSHPRGTRQAASTPSEGSEPELSRLMENLQTGTHDLEAAMQPPAASPAGGSVAETTVDSVDYTRSSLADSGHFDDLTSPSLSSRDPLETNRLRDTHTEEEVEEEDEVDEDVDEAVGGAGVDAWAGVEEVEGRLREEYYRREEALKRNHLEEYHEMKERHNDKVEVLLSKLSDANLKYFELRPVYDQSQERVRDLEREGARLKEEVTDAELRHQKMYLQMFLKGQQAARIQAEDDLDGGEEGLGSPLTSSSPMMELMRQLTRTEEELEKVKVSDDGDDDDDDDGECGDTFL
ncbi:hypothetical protein GWK47_041306 [Chionoecetes opilio]|uniref:Uncharacterized protein n=1 Tax=Chionoecetes opilio TaxID=41210 RepID=A0A8J5CKM4_CHIOP|nr:hypothetical protein GWK47_041306 [Chionoecetes opilio]